MRLQLAMQEYHPSEKGNKQGDLCFLPADSVQTSALQGECQTEPNNFTEIRVQKAKGARAEKEAELGRGRSRIANQAPEQPVPTQR